MKQATTPGIGDEEVQNLAHQTAELLEQLRKAGTINQPQSVLKRYAPSKVAGPFSDGHDFFKALIQCPNGSYSHHAKMNQWIEYNEQNRKKSTPTGLNETVAADGGVLVPPEVAQTILMRVYGNQLLGMTTMMPIGTSNTLRIHEVNESSRADGSRYGGVLGYWEGEEDETALTKPGLSMLELRAKRLTAAARATDEVLADSAGALESFLNIVVPGELEFQIGKALVRGNGVNKPEGILNSPSKVTVSKQVGQAAATLTARNVNAMWARLHPSCRDKAVWIYDQSIEPALDEMTIGTAGAQLAVYLPMGGLSANRYATIKGRPAMPVEFCSQLGTVGDLILFDPSTVISIARGGLMSAVSMHVYFLAHSQVFRFSVRMDAKSWWRTTLTPHSGGDVQSNVVVLETRS